MCFDTHSYFLFAVKTRASFKNGFRFAFKADATSSISPDSIAIIKGVTPQFVIASISTDSSSNSWLKISRRPARHAKCSAVLPTLSF